MSINQKRPTQADDFIRIQDLLYLCLAKWKWFVLSLAVTVGIAVFYLLRTPAVYTRTASVLIKDDSKGKSVSSDLESFSEFGLFQSSTNVNNELVALQSPAVMTEVVKRLHLDMNYTVPGRFHRRVAYGPTLPVSVSINDLSEVLLVFMIRIIFFESFEIVTFSKAISALSVSLSFNTI